ncbi:MAG: hypothetical protein EFT35_02975 [Methanophagales archaeon ANME-1-THS]|nr:MAG: hypothetical protein EFT35_02975 [Methanophagales archaeon ANME-1-THS]
MTLLKEVKERLEAAMNNWLMQSDEIAGAGFDFLECLGVAPKLETLLGYTIGVWDSIAGSFIHHHYDRGMTEEEDKELIELIRSKIPELERKSRT